MAIRQEDWIYETKRLEKVIDIIDKQLAEKRNEIVKYGREVKETRRSMWENAAHGFNNLDEIVEAKQYLDGITQELIKQNLVKQQVHRLEKMRPSPYFGRFDFIEEGSDELENIYVGISTLKDENTGEIYIYDWRAPISSLFYEAETGPAQYLSPGGIVRGDITLKRQYNIVNGKIQYMFDSSIKIDDDILQGILSKSADEKMRTIVTSIQREQNKAIRDETHKLLIVQGPAGSGKTSIALHRIAFLLYRYRDTVSASNIVIFSPNRIFNDYISDVLPNLGEENMQQTTFRECAENFLPRGLKIEDINGQMEFLLSERKSPVYRTRVKSMQFKSSSDFVQIIKNYARYLENEGVVFEDVRHRDQLVISGSDLTKLFREDYSYLPLYKRLEKIRQRIYFLLEPMENRYKKQKEEELADSAEYIDAGEIKARALLSTREHFSRVKSYVEQITDINVFDLYSNLFKDSRLFARMAENVPLPEEYKAILEYTCEKLSMGNVDYEDAAALLLLRSELGGIPAVRDIKYVIIDEAQDYTPMQYEIFRQLFPDAGFTLLGDLSQSINSITGVKDFGSVLVIFRTENAGIIKLTKSYRSTAQITRFARSLLDTPVEDEYIEREGEEPVIKFFSNEDEIIGTIPQSIQELREKGARSIAIICKNAAESRRVYAKLRHKNRITLVTGDDEEFVRGTVVIPSYLAKGLEFDAVVVYNASKEAYGIESERRLLYTVCTRALHHLHVYVAGEQSPFIR